MDHVMVARGHNEPNGVVDQQLQGVRQRGDAAHAGDSQDGPMLCRFGNRSQRKALDDDYILKHTGSRISYPISHLSCLHRDNMAKSYPQYRSTWRRTVLGNFKNETCSRARQVGH